MTTYFIMAAIVIFILGLAKGGLGGTLGVLATPLMSLVMPADEVIGLLLPILIIADVFAVGAHWGHWQTQLLWRLMGGAFLGMVAASFVIASITPDALQRGIGVVVVLFVLYKVFEDRLNALGNYTPRGWHGIVAGIIGGFTSTLAHTGGPPVAIYLLMQNMSPRAFVATSAIFFFLMNLIKVPSYFYLDLFDFQKLWQVAWLLPLLPVGVWLGQQLAIKVDKMLFDRVIVGLLSLSAVFLLFG